MIVGLYGRPQHHPLAALALGCQAAGLDVQWRRPSVFEPRLARRTFGAVVTYGFHAGAELVHETYERLGIPTIVTDLGHCRRASSGHEGVSAGEGYYQMGLGKLGWLPPFPCPTDRSAALDLPMQPRVSGDAVLLVAQKPGDANHWLSAQQMAEWGAAAVQTIRAAGWTGPIIWRRHPKGAPVPAPAGVTATSDPEAEPIAALFPQLHCLVTNTSTAGLEALLAGVPVVCHPDAMYAPLATTDLGLVCEPRFPTDAERLAFFARVAYAQWTLAELRTATPIRFILACARGEAPVPVDEAAVPVATPRPRRSRGSRARVTGADVVAEAAA